MKGPSQLNIIRLTFASIALILAISATNLHWGKNNWQDIVEADAKGYYAYLPAIFIYQDLNFYFMDQVEKKANDAHHYFDYRTYSGKKEANKYYCGTAIAEAPFFVVAHLITKVSEYETDGYSKYYLLSITIAAIFYCLLGLWAFFQCLEFFNIRYEIKIISMFILVFGTNLYYYTVGEPGMSHVYSFAFVALFFLVSLRWFRDQSNSQLFQLAFLLGMIVLIRPINILIIGALPFVAGCFLILKKAAQHLFNQPKPLFLALLAFLALISIQATFYKIATGSFFLYSYGNETFHFFDSHFFDFLFSYKKGLFLYTPVIFFSLPGLWFLWKGNRFRFFSFSIFFVAIIFILSAWWSWWYGGSFSSRVFVEYLPVYGILTAILLQNIWKKRLFYPTIVLFFLLIGLCQFQTFQYRHYLIHWEDMTGEKYWDVFLKLPEEK